jgi:hypothetical protein
MSIMSHLSELQRKHQTLERQIQNEMNHPHSDELRLTALKRRKLYLKDEISRINSFATRRSTVH